MLCGVLCCVLVFFLFVGFFCVGLLGLGSAGFLFFAGVGFLFLGGLFFGWVGLLFFVGGVWLGFFYP